MDILARLKSIADLKTGDPIPDWLKGANGWGDALSQTCRDAIKEIEHLRSLAGAVSHGQTFAEVRAEGRMLYNVYDTPVLKAFDGA